MRVVAYKAVPIAQQWLVAETLFSTSVTAIFVDADYLASEPQKVELSIVFASKKKVNIPEGCLVGSSHPKFGLFPFGI